MAKPPRLSKSELLEKHDDAIWREKVLDILQLRGFLYASVIDSDYTISDALNGALALSDYGEWLQRELGKKKVPTKEARLLCLLELWHLDLLVDPERIDVDKLATAIGAELQDGRLHLAMTHGPELYLKAAGMFPDERRSLSTSDSFRLLDGTPIGVFQNGRWVSGPFGIVRSREWRPMGASSTIPLQHCHDVSCRRVHRVSLETDRSAAINEHREGTRKLLESGAPEPSDFAAFLVEIGRDDKRKYDDFNTGTLGLVLGDAFSESELRLILAAICKIDPALRNLFSELGITGALVEAAAALGRASLLQAVLIADDRTIISALDKLVAAKEIVIPVGEVRSPVLARGVRTGAFDCAVEVSRWGTRIASTADLAPLRLRRLVDKIFKSDDVTEYEELGWQLREVSGMTLTARLDEYLRTASPDDVVRRLILARRRNFELAVAELGIVTTDEEARDDDLINQVLWKLGFEVNVTQRIHDRFWQLHEEITQSARSAMVSTVVNQEAMRGLGANYFRSLEKILSDTLVFASWALLNDHVEAQRPFEYDDDRCRVFGWTALNESDSNAEGPAKTPMEFGDSSTLYVLCRGFAVLAKHLEALRANPEAHRRDAGSLPRFASNTTLQEFPFLHSNAFLDLTASSQATLIESLREASRALVAGKVSDVRNEQIHYRRSSSDLRTLLESLEATRRAVRILEDLGLTRVPFRPGRIEADQWFRTTIYFADGRGREFPLGRPSAFSWLNLPSLERTQYLITAAQFAEPNEILRISQGATSQFSQMWEGYPSRREDSGASMSGDSDTLDAPSKQLGAAAVGT